MAGGFFGRWFGRVAGAWWGGTEEEQQAWDTAQGIAALFKPMRAGHAIPAGAELVVRFATPAVSGSSRGGVVPERVQVSIRAQSADAFGNVAAGVAPAGATEMRIRGATPLAGGAAGAVLHGCDTPIIVPDFPVGGGGGVRAQGVALRVLAWQAEAEGIQNLTDEELILLIHAARGLDTGHVYR